MEGQIKEWKEKGNQDEGMEEKGNQDKRVCTKESRDQGILGRPDSKGARGYNGVRGVQVAKGTI